MDELEMNPDERKPEQSAELTAAQTTIPEECATPEKTEQMIAGEDEAAGETAQVTEDAPAEDAPAEDASAEDRTTPDVPEGEKKKASPGKIALAVAFVVVLAAALIALVLSGRSGKESELPSEEPAQQTDAATDPVEETVEYTIPADGNPDDVTCKGSYTASDDEVIAARDAVVATAGAHELTVGQLQVYYWMQVREFLSQYGYYLSYFGLDYTQGLDKQLCPAVEGQTWQQYFLDQALLCWQSYQSMAAEAEKHGVEMKPEYLQEMEEMTANLEETAKNSGFDSVDALVTGMLGGAATYSDYENFMNLYYAGLGYFSDVTGNYTVTEEEAEAYFDENAASYEENGITKDSVLVDVRHILIMPEGATSETIRTESFSEDAWAASEKRANEILQMWKDGRMTEESFAELAGEHSQDEGSSGNGGLYSDVSQGQMVQEFNDWCFDAGRQPGDFGIVKTDFGYHIMYFCESRPEWKDYAREDLLAKMTNDFVEETANLYPLNVSYDKILLAFVDLAAE